MKDEKMSLQLYGIKNCDTMKKAQAYLVTHGLSYEFIDYKNPGVVAAHLPDWNRRVGWQVLLNTRGQMWRKLSDAERADLNETKALALMSTYPVLIKRPVLETGTKLIIGFSPALYESELVL